MTISPVIYGEMDPYEEKQDKALMVFTQLAHSVVMFCGVVVDTVEAEIAGVIVGIISLLVLVPMFITLFLYIIDPRSVPRGQLCQLSLLTRALPFSAARPSSVSKGSATNSVADNCRSFRSASQRMTRSLEDGIK